MKLSQIVKLNYKILDFVYDVRVVRDSVTDKKGRNKGDVCYYIVFAIRLI